MTSNKSSKKTLTASFKKIISRKKPVKKTAPKKAVVKKKVPVKRKVAAKPKVKKAAVKKIAKPKVKKAAVKKVAKPKKVTAKPKTKKAAAKTKVKKAAVKKEEAKPKPPKYTFRKLKKNPDHYQFLLDRVGEEGMTVVKKIVSDEVSDVDLAETLSSMKPNIVRKHLYALYEAGVVTYRRHRSKTGWYTYYWKLHPDRIDTAIMGTKQNILKELGEIIEYERENDFYECKKGCSRVVFDEAMDMRFRCPRCENQLEFKDNTKAVSQLQKEANRLSR